MSYYKCPKCGSSDVFWWEESVIERKYKIKQDGNPYKRAFSTENSFADPLQGVQCNKCNYSDNWISLEFEEWKVDRGVNNERGC